jgi:hypothetical protein
MGMGTLFQEGTAGRLNRSGKSMNKNFSMTSLVPAISAPVMLVHRKAAKGVK